MKGTLTIPVMGQMHHYTVEVEVPGEHAVGANAVAVDATLEQAMALRNPIALPIRVLQRRITK